MLLKCQLRRVTCGLTDFGKRHIGNDLAKDNNLHVKTTLQLSNECILWRKKKLSSNLLKIKDYAATEQYNFFDCIQQSSREHYKKTIMIINSLYWVIVGSLCLSTLWSFKFEYFSWTLWA